MPAETSSAAAASQVKASLVQKMLLKNATGAEKPASSVFFSLTKPAPFGSSLRSSDVSVELLRATVLLTKVTLRASSIVTPPPTSVARLFVIMLFTMSTRDAPNGGRAAGVPIVSSSIIPPPSSFERFDEITFRSTSTRPEPSAGVAGLRPGGYSPAIMIPPPESKASLP